MRSAWAIAAASAASAVANSARTCADRSLVFGQRQQRDGLAGGHAAARERRDQRPVLAAAHDRLHLHDRPRRGVAPAARRTPPAVPASSTASSGSPGPGRRLPMSWAFHVSITVVGRPASEDHQRSERPRLRVAAARACAPAGSGSRRAGSGRRGSRPTRLRRSRTKYSRNRPTTMPGDADARPARRSRCAPRPARPAAREPGPARARAAA